MAPKLEWHRGPISGRLILCADGALWPRAEVLREPGGFVPVLCTEVDVAPRVIGRFAVLAQAQAAAEQALTAAVGRELPALRTA
jgi:hypothetical protein